MLDPETQLERRLLHRMPYFDAGSILPPLYRDKVELLWRARFNENEPIRLIDGGRFTKAITKQLGIDDPHQYQAVEAYVDHQIWLDKI